MGGVRYRAQRVLCAQWRGALGLVAAVAAIGGVTLVLTAGVVRTATAADRYEQERVDRFDIAIEQAAGLPRTEEVEALPAVDSMVAATFVFGGFLLEGGGPVDAIAFAGSPQALAADLIDGRLPDAGRPDEFVASEAFLETSGAVLGDEMAFVRIGRERADELGFDAFAEGPDLPGLRARLVGVVGGPSELQDEFPFTVFPAALLDDEPIGVAATPGLISLVEGAEVADLRDQLDTLPENDVFSLTPVEWVPGEVRDAATTQARAQGVIAAIAGLAGLVVVGQLATRQARSTDAQRDALIALGLTRAQVVAETVTRVGVPALVGGVGASALALAVSDRFPTGFMSRLEPAPGLRLEPSVHVLGPLVLAAGVALWVGVAVVVAARHPPRSRRTSWVDAVALRLGRARIGMGLRFAFGRHGHRAGSAVAALVGVVGLVAALVAAATFASSFEAVLDDPARQGYTFDLAGGQGGGPVADGVAGTLAEDPDVAALALLGNIRVDVDGRPLDVVGVQPVEGTFEVVVLSGDEAAGPDEIVLGAKAAERLEVEVGDDLVVESGAGSRRLRVTGLAVIPAVEGGDGVGEGGLVNGATFHALDPDGEFGLTAPAITLREGASATTTADRLSEATGMTLGVLDPSGVIVNHDRVRSAPRVIAGLVAVLVVISMTNLVVATVRRRGRDVAVLRALGADQGWVAAVGHWQALALVAVVTVVAVPVGTSAGRVVFRLLAGSIGVADDVILPGAAFVAGALVLVVVADLSASLALRRSRRESIARRLAKE